MNDSFNLNESSRWTIRIDSRLLKRFVQNESFGIAKIHAVGNTLSEESSFLLNQSFLIMTHESFTVNRIMHLPENGSYSVKAWRDPSLNEKLGDSICIAVNLKWFIWTNLENRFLKAKWIDSSKRIEPPNSTIYVSICTLIGLAFFT